MRGTSTATGGGTSASHSQALVAARGVNVGTAWSSEALIPAEPWMADARCAETDPEIFFVDKGGSAVEAKEVCAGCDVAEQCLAYALRTNETHGIWGGMTGFERRGMRKAS